MINFSQVIYNLPTIFNKWCTCSRHRVTVESQSSLNVCIQSRPFASPFNWLSSTHSPVCFENERRGSEANSNISFSFFPFNGDVLHDLFKWQTSPVSLFLSWGISHWVLMSDYFTSHSALDKWLRRAVKNRSKPLGWERGGGGGRSREAVKSPPSLLLLLRRPTGRRKCHPLFVCSG